MLELRRFFEHLMGIEPVAPGEDTQWHLRWHLGWPDWLVLVFLVFAVGFVFWIYLRDGSTATRMQKLFLASVRLVVILLVLLMLSGLEISIDRTGLPYLVFLIDDSESMKIRDRQPQIESAQDSPSRLEAVGRWLENESWRLQSLTNQHKLRFYAQASNTRELGICIKPAEFLDLLDKVRALEPVGSESRLGSNLRSVLNDLRGTPPSAIISITDGITTAGEPLLQAAQYANHKNIPVFTIGVGDPEELRDLELHDLLVDDAVFVSDIITFEAKLTGRGFEGQEVEVVLREKGSDVPLDKRKYLIPPDAKPIKIRLSHSAPSIPGMIDYEIDVPIAEREIRVENNHLERRVRVLKERIRVLYVESFPRYEFRFLKNLLEREQTIELSTVLLDADEEYVQQDRTAISFIPTNKKELFEFDVLIFGDVDPSFLTQVELENIRDFVRVKGGGFLLISGSHFAPQEYRDTILADILPIEIGATPNRFLEGSRTFGFHPELTFEGRSSPIFRFALDEQENESILDSLPVLYWYARVEKAKPGAQVLAVHPSEKKDGRPLPLVATQFFGSGRTYFQAFDSTWRWRGGYENLYHGHYWIQAVRYLSRSKLFGKNRQVELLVDRRRYERGAPILLRVRFLDESLTPDSDDGVSVLLDQEAHGQRSLKLGRVSGNRAVFETFLGQLSDGRYRARLASPLVESMPSVEFEVVPPPGELDDIQMNESELRRVAELTDGEYYSLAEADSLLDHLPPGRRVALYTDPPISLWNTWVVLALFFGSLLLEWVVRKRKSML